MLARFLPPSALALALLLAACFYDGGLASTAATAATSGTSTGTSTTTDPGTSTTLPSSTSAATTDLTGTSTSSVDPTDTSSTGAFSSSSTGPATTGTSTGDLCPDPGPEPNNTEDMAADAANIDCDSQVADNQYVLDGNTDVDWFTFEATYQGLSCGKSDTPTLYVAIGSPARLCAYAECVDGADIAVTCLEGEPATSPNSRPGCCDAEIVQFTADCADSPDKSVRVWVHIAQDSPACLDYTLKYTFMK